MGDVPQWLEQFVKRLMALTPGRWLIVLTVGKEHDWSISGPEKVERP